MANGNGAGGEKRGYTFVVAPVPVLDAAGLSNSAKLTYLHLLKYAWQDGECFPGQARLAEDMHMSVDSVQRDLRELREYGLISWARRGDRTNMYQIHDITTHEPLGMGHALGYTSDSGHGAEARTTPSAVETESAALEATGSEDRTTHMYESVPIPMHNTVTRRRSETAPERSADTADTRHENAVSKRHNTDPEGLRPRRTKTQQPARVVVLDERRKAKPATEGTPEGALLVGYGVSAARADALVEQYGEAAVTRQVDALRHRLARRPGSVGDPAGWLVRAIEEGYTQPPRAIGMDATQPTPRTHPLMIVADAADDEADPWDAVTEPTLKPFRHAASFAPTPNPSPDYEGGESETFLLPSLVVGGRAGDGGGFSDHPTGCDGAALPMQDGDAPAWQAAVVAQVARGLRPERAAIIAAGQFRPDPAQAQAGTWPPPLPTKPTVRLRLARQWQAATISAAERTQVEMALADTFSRVVRLIID